MEYYKVTKKNIDEAKENCCSCDQARELRPGCETWGIIYPPGNQRGQMTRWPNGRGAVCFGCESEWGDWESEWGDWEGDLLHIDNEDLYYDKDGEMVDGFGLPTEDTYNSDA